MSEDSKNITEQCSIHY